MVIIQHMRRPAAVVCASTGHHAKVIVTCKNRLPHQPNAPKSPNYEFMDYTIWVFFFTSLTELILTYFIISHGILSVFKSYASSM